MSESITVAIPYHQNLDYLRHTITSILQQTHQPSEIIIADDSPDGSARALVGMSPRIRHIHNSPPLGMAENFNLCLEETKTTLVCLLHGDDMLAPNYLEMMGDMAQRYPSAAAFFCEAFIIDGEGNAVLSFKDWAKQFIWPGRGMEYLIENEDGFKSLAHCNFIITPSVCYRVPAMRGIRFETQYKFSTDWVMYMNLLLSGAFLVGRREKAVYYRRHPTSATAVFQRTGNRYQEDMTILARISDQAKQKGWHSASRVAKIHALHALYISYAIAMSLVRGRWSRGYSLLCVLMGSYRDRKQL